MSVRTCLLCGKTLVRIRVGAGGDFCSREHRNQYQLRRGMDCLAEANKVSTLARRRETPKALFGEASEGSSARRAFLDAAPFGILAGLSPGVRQPRERNRLALLPRAGALAEPLAGVRPQRGAAEICDEICRLYAPVTLPHGPSAEWKPGGLGGTPTHPLMGIAVAAAPGSALRVSSSAGFRLQAPHPPSVTYTARTGHGGIAGMKARAESRLSPLRQECRGAAADARLAFVEMGFSSAPEEPARLGWLAAERETDIERERREL